MISLIHVTNRGLYPLTHERLRHLSQYELLSECLRQQTLNDFELVVVDKYNPFPRPELHWLGERVQYARPRETPFSALGAFSPSVARNTGLALVHGDVTFSIDDCTSFSPTLLQQIATAAIDHRYVVPVYIKHTGEFWGWHDERHCGGILAYPTDVARAAGGWEERFTGGYALEDWEFSRRLHSRGVRFMQTNDATVKLEAHEPRKGDYMRCCWAVDAMLEGQDTANQAWTPDQMAVFTAPRCTFFDPANYCLARSKPGCCCDRRPTAQTIAAIIACET